MIREFGQRVLSGVADALASILVGLYVLLCMVAVLLALGGVVLLLYIAVQDAVVAVGVLLVCVFAYVVGAFMRS